MSDPILVCPVASCGCDYRQSAGACPACGHLAGVTPRLALAAPPAESAPLPLRPSTQRQAEAFCGALRDDANRVVWVCGHAHARKELSTPQSGHSALDCAWAELRSRREAQQGTRP